MIYLKDISLNNICYAKINLKNKLNTTNNVNAFTINIK